MNLQSTRSKSCRASLNNAEGAVSKCSVINAAAQPAPRAAVDALSNIDVWTVMKSFQDGISAQDHIDADQAAALGHLSLLPMILTPSHRLRSAVKLTTAAQDSASQAGHLQLVQWLEQHTDAGCTSAALIGAVRGGHAAVVMHHTLYRAEGCLWSAMDAAAVCGDVPLLASLHTLSQQQPGLADTAQLTSRARVDAAAAAGHIHVLDWLAEHRSGLESCTHAAVDSAAANGQLRALQWLQQHTGTAVEQFVPFFLRVCV